MKITNVRDALNLPFDRVMSSEILRDQFYLQAKEVIAERDRLRAEVEALRKDAERYRWLREQQEDGDADYAVMKFNRRANGWLHLDWKLDVEIDGVMVAKEMV